MSASRCFIAASILALMLAPPTRAHETDQYTLPHGREFADLGDYFNRWAFNHIEAGMERTNARIAAAIARNASQDEIAALQSSDEIVTSVNRSFPWAMDVIEGLESVLSSPEMKRRYPGRVIGYKEPFTNIYQNVHFILDPRQFFRLFLGSTMKINGVYVGTDKIGHFTDMGMNYYREYSKALRNGKTPEEATQAAVYMGTHGLIFSERGMLGFMSAGAYSNADLAANYLGLLFYINLTQPVPLQGKLHPPMLERDGPFWKLAPHVRRDNNFFAAYISDHLNEVVNPSLFESGMRPAVRRAVQRRTDVILARYSDEHGNRRPRQWFDDKLQEVRTYWGVDYGHMGEPDQLVTVSNTCFPALGDPDDAEQNPRPPLYLAIRSGDRARAKTLLESGDNVNAVVRTDFDPSEWLDTPLHVAAAKGDAELVRLLMAKGAGPDTANYLGITPLHRAINHPDVAAALAESSAKPNPADVRGRTPLHWAAADQRGDAMAVLLDHNADPNALDHQKQTPLHRAAESGNDLAAAELLRRGATVATPDVFRRTPLHLAAANNRPDMLRLLLRNDAPVDARDDFGCTPLHDAARAGHENAVLLLLDAGADPNAADDYGTTPLHLAARNSRLTVAQQLLDKGARINARNAAGTMPLHEAASSGDKRLVRVLLDRGADPKAENYRDDTPAELAAARRYSEIVTMIRKAPPATTPRAGK